MNTEELLQKIARLESLNDQLLTELKSVDALVRKIGFDDGLTTLKSAAQELLDEERLNSEDEANPPLAS